nr:MAG TPA: hypothetical protein [Caudoviricetes sp.]
MANRVLYVKYLNDNKALNSKGIAVNVYQGVKDYCFLTEGLSLLKIELHDHIQTLYIFQCLMLH